MGNGTGIAFSLVDTFRIPVFFRCLHIFLYTRSVHRLVWQNIESFVTPKREGDKK